MTDKTGVQQALAKNAGGKLERATVKDLLEKNKMEIAVALPKHLTIDRMIKVLLLATDRQPDLLKCSQRALVQAMVQCAELGLEPGGVRGLVYLIPRKVKGEDLNRDCQVLVGFRGLIHLAKQSGELLDVEAHVVHEGDIWQHQKGFNPILRHVPCEAPGRPLRVYAIAHLRSGLQHAEVMPWAEVEKIRGQSQGYQFDPKGSVWALHESEMARKTAVRRLMKYVEISPELEAALAREDMAELVPEIEVTAPPAPKKRALKVEPIDAELTAGDIDPDEVARQAANEQAEKALAAAEKGGAK